MKKLIYPALIIICLVYLNKNIELDSNEIFINKILSHSDFNTNKQINVIDELLLVINIDIDKPVTILKNSFHNDYSISFVYNENIKSNYQIYIYNTHPLELYDSSYLEGYDISPGVVMASKMLTTKLNEVGINTLLEKGNVTDYLKKNNLNYDYSYEGSREFVNNILNKYPNLDLIIDLHRDGTDKDTSTINIDGVNYARVMFVQNTSLKENFSLAQSLSGSINNKYPSLSRGVYEKHSGKFNQDLNKNIILLELGGNYNKIEEVSNTIDALVDIIKEKYESKITN